MSLFKYTATTPRGEHFDGTIDAPTVDTAIGVLQQRGLIIISIDEASKKPFWKMDIAFFDAVSLNDTVVLSRQLATLFEAKVPVLDSFKLLAAESQNSTLRKVLAEMIDAIEGGVPISTAMQKHPNVFSSFYVNMIRAGEESGKLSESLTYLAEYLERSEELITKVRNALIYPAFVIASFIVIMIIMLVVVIPQLTAILKDTGQVLPLTTRIVIGVSNLFVHYGIFMAIGFVLIALVAWRFAKTEAGRIAIGRFQLSVPYLGDLYRKLYVARISDNMDTMLSSGISMVRAIEITAEVVGSEIYRQILLEARDAVRAGSSFSQGISPYKEMPRIVVQMSRIGEETGKLGYVLKTIARFYKREVNGAVDTIVGLIEPLMIVVLGLGVGVLLTAVLGPIYNIASGF